MSDNVAPTGPNNVSQMGSKVLSENKYDKLIQYSAKIIEEYSGDLIEDIRDYIRDYPDEIDRIDELLYKHAISVIITYRGKISKEELELLLYRKHKNINQSYELTDGNVFHVLCFHKSITLEIIKYVIEETDITNENINKLDRDDWSILHCLCMNESVTLPMVKYIIEDTEFNRELLNIIDGFGNNILHILCYNEGITLPIIKYIIKNTNINVNQTNIYNCNIIYYLCDIKQFDPNKLLEIIKYIVEETDFNIENINQRSSDNKRPIDCLSDDKIEIKEYLSGFTSVPGEL